MRSSTEDEASTRVVRAMKVRMAHNAIAGFRELDARTVLSLQNAGALRGVSLKDTGETPPKDLGGVLSDPRHPCRLPAPPGPHVFHTAAAASGQGNVTSALDGLLFSSHSVRAASLGHLRSLEAVEPSCLTARSRQALARAGQKVLSKRARIWRAAAVELADTLDDDWLLDLSAAGQCLEFGFLPGLRRHLRRVLRPSVASVQPIDLKWWEPKKQRAEIEGEVVRIANGSHSLAAAMSAYIREFGHVPYRPDLSMGRLVSEWLRLHPGAPAPAGNDLWAWADAMRSPLARYHVCQTFVHCPRLLAEADGARFWTEVSAVVAWQRLPAGQAGSSLPWLFLCGLARHYAQHFECLLPGKDGERLSTLAWWLAARVRVRHVRRVISVDIGGAVCPVPVPSAVLAEP